MAACVGPIVQACALGRAVVDAIRELNPDVQVIDRGSYYRVLVEGQCLLTRAAVQRITGRAFALPSDLESVMPAFQGTLHMGRERVDWRSEPR